MSNPTKHERSLPAVITRGELGALTAALAAMDSKVERLLAALESAEQALRHAGPVTRNLVADRLKALSGDFDA